MTDNPHSLVPGQYVTVHGSGLTGALIRRFTHAPVAHAYVYTGPGQLGHDLVEAGPKGITAGHVADYDWATSFPSKTIPTPTQSALMRETALSMIGHRYGWLADALIGMRTVLGVRVWPWVFKLRAVTSRMECAQLADYVGMVNGVHYFDDGREPGSVSPADLWRRDYGNPA